MKKSEIAKYLEQVKRDRKARFDFQAKNRIAELEDYGRRSRKAGKILDDLWEKGAAAAGIDAKRLERLHDQDNQAAGKFRAKQVTGIKSYAMRRAEQKKRLCDEIYQTLRRKFKGKLENPIVPLCIAANISSNYAHLGTTDCTNLELTTVALGNACRFGCEVGGRWAPRSQVIQEIYFDFIWQESTITGIAEAVAHVELDGTYSLSADGTCLRTRSAGISIKADTHCAQLYGDYIGEEVTNMTEILSEVVESQCSARSTSGVVDDESLRLVSQHAVPVIAGRPVIASVTFHVFYSTSENSRVELDMIGDSSFGLRVPGIHLVFPDEG